MCKKFYKHKQLFFKMIRFGENGCDLMNMLSKTMQNSPFSYVIFL